MERITERDEHGNWKIKRFTEILPAYWQACNRLAAYEDTGLEPEDLTRVFNEEAILKLAGQVLGTTPDRLRELAQADREGRVVVLPFKQHKTLSDMSNPQHPEMLKDFRISATWTHCGIVFHSPWGIFLQQIERGYIKQVSDAAEKALGGGGDG